MKIHEIGEFGLIRRMKSKLPPLSSKVIHGIGDDTAVLLPEEHKYLLMSSDMIVEDVHFTLQYCPLDSVGWKALAVNLSDVASMGGSIGHATVSLAIPKSFEVEQVEELYLGLGNCAREYGCDIVGGDVVKSLGGLMIDVAVLGFVEYHKEVYRSGAKPGDVIMVTGPVGNSAAGLHVLSQGWHHNVPEGVSLNVVENLREAHLYPKPRMQAGSCLGALGIVTAMNDISDGLASEVTEICEASGVGCVLDGDTIPCSEDLLNIATIAQVDPLKWALFGGEDYELVFTTAESKVDEVLLELSKVGSMATVIGHIDKPEKGCILRRDGQINHLNFGGFNHF